LIQCGEPQIGALEREYVNAVLAGGRLTEGEWCRRFAESLEAAVGSHCIPVSSGTAALHLALLAVGVQPGDEVIVPALTYVATANAVLMCRAKPVVADVDEKTWTISEHSVSMRLSRRTRAIMPVHLYGVPAPSMHDIVSGVYRRTGRRVAVVEDCAEALGVVPTGDAAAWSFYGSKTITTGEGGAVSCSDPLVYDRAWHLAHQGQTSRRYEHDTLAWNYRMTELQAALGVAQMERLDEFLARREQVFAWYDARLAGRFTRQQCSGRHCYWAYAILVPGRDAAAAAMLEAGVETRPVFLPVHHHRHLAPHGTYCETASRISASGLVLPTHCGLTEEDVDTVCKELFRATDTA